MRPIRRSPLGFLIDEGPTGDLMLHESENLLDAKRAIQSENYTRAQHKDGIWTVWISRTEHPGPDNHDEWGSSQDHDEAWRYALGAALGGYDDPIVMEEPQFD